MSVSVKRWMVVIAIVLALGYGAYHFAEGSVKERRLSGVIGALVGYAAGRYIADMVISDVAPMGPVAGGA